LIVIKENKKDRKIEIIFSVDRFILSLEIKFFKPKIDTAARVGMESKKDIFSASCLLKFKNLAAVIVILTYLHQESKIKFEIIL